VVVVKVVRVFKVVAIALGAYGLTIVPMIEIGGRVVTIGVAIVVLMNDGEGVWRNI
jgi:hypothetical protein